MRNSPAGNFEGLAAASVAPWSASVLTRSAVILPSFRAAELGGHVVVAGEGVGLQVLRAVLDPLDRLADHQRGGDRA